MLRSQSRSASVKDIAALAGVSLGTVSNVLNRPDRVSVRTRAKVEAAISELGYVRNESARQLRAGTSRILAYVMLDARNPFFTDVAGGIEIAAGAVDLSVIMCDSGQVVSREAAHLDLLVQQRVQGVLITPIDPDSPRLEEVRRLGTPVVIVDRTSDSRRFCSVAVDDRLGGRLAIEHLIDRGHTRLAFIGGPITLGQVRDRLAGAREAMVEFGLNPNELLVLGTDSLDVGAGREAGQRLTGLTASRRPTGVFCANDLVALGLLQQAMRAGLRVPHDLAIVGYDDIEFAEAAAVPLTSVRQPRRELGRAAAQLLIDEATNPDHVHEQIAFSAELVARDST